MFSEKDYGIAEDPAHARARAVLLQQIALGEDQVKQLIKYCADNIPQDRYVYPKNTRFVAYADNFQMQVNDGPTIRAQNKVHRHALNQVCSTLKLPGKLVSRLFVKTHNDYAKDLLAHNFNTLLWNMELLNRRRQPAKFLHRVVQGEVRAFLTQSYNRHLVSHVVLQPFLSVCQEVGLRPAKAFITDMRVALDAYLPFAFQPIPGEFVALGASWSNSDFGQGRLTISHTVKRVRGGGSIATEDSFSKVHIGAVVEESDIMLDESVAIKELDAVAAAIQSAVREVMQPENVANLIEAIKAAAQQEIPWDKMKLHLSKFLHVEEVKNLDKMMENSAMEELPPPGMGANGEPLASKWWAAAAVSSLAERTTDPTRRMELVSQAGKLLSTDK